MQHKHKDAIVAWANGKLIGFRYHKEKPLVVTSKPDWDNAQLIFEVVDDKDVPALLQKELTWLASAEGLTAGSTPRQLSADRALLLFNYMIGSK